jgi:hypothetical protein
MKIISNFITETLERDVAMHPELINKPITLFYDYPLMDASQLNYNRYNVLFIQEPNQLFGFHDWTLKYGHYFDCIFTWSQPILDTYPNNSVFFPFGNAELGYEFEQYHADKKFEVSYLCGNKRMIEGHLLRHRVYDMENKIEIPKNIMYTAPWVTGKLPCWKSMYHIAIENSKNKNYFTEKIVESFLAKTIPLYWGCPNISDFFNSDGYITFDNENELIDIVNTLTPEYYESKKDVINENYEKAMRYAPFVYRIKDILIEFCKINSI